MLIVQNAAQPAGIRDAIVDLITDRTTDVRVASAYVTFGGADILLSALKHAVGAAAFSAMPKMLITSFDYGITEPKALRRWRELDNSQVFVSGAYPSCRYGRHVSFLSCIPSPETEYEEVAPNYFRSGAAVAFQDPIL